MDPKIYDPEDLLTSGDWEDEDIHRQENNDDYDRF